MQDSAGEVEQLRCPSVESETDYNVASPRRLFLKLGFSFFLFGLINNGIHPLCTYRDFTSHFWFQYCMS